MPRIRPCWLMLVFLFCDGTGAMPLRLQPCSALTKIPRFVYLAAVCGVDQFYRSSFVQIGRLIGRVSNGILPKTAPRMLLDRERSHFSVSSAKLCRTYLLCGKRAHSLTPGHSANL